MFNTYISVIIIKATKVVTADYGPRVRDKKQMVIVSYPVRAFGLDY